MYNLLFNNKVVSHIHKDALTEHTVLALLEAGFCIAGTYNGVQQ
jgi:hypothetical protein